MADRTKEETDRVAAPRVKAFYDTMPAQVQQETAALPKRMATMNARTSIKIGQLNAAADKVFAHVDGLVACRRGCSHCCHIAVRITVAEAQYIGEHIGLAPKPAPRKSAYDIKDFSDQTPCPFLVNDECSIYPWRPLECRSNFNFDQDNHWCLYENWDKPGSTIPKPYVKPLGLAHRVVVRATAATATVADVRDFFPNGTRGD